MLLPGLSWRIGTPHYRNTSCTWGSNGRTTLEATKRTHAPGPGRSPSSTAATREKQGSPPQFMVTTTTAATGLRLPQEVPALLATAPWGKQGAEWERSLPLLSRPEGREHREGEERRKEADISFKGKSNNFTKEDEPGAGKAWPGCSVVLVAFNEYMAFILLIQRVGKCARNKIQHSSIITL